MTVRQSFGQSKRTKESKVGSRVIFLLAGATLLTSGCLDFVYMAAIAYPDRETITVQSVPNQAAVTLKTPSGKPIADGKTPLEVQISCSDSVVITVAAEGYDPQTINDAAIPQPDFLRRPVKKVCHAMDIVNVVLNRTNI